MKITHVIESGGGSADFVLYLVKYLPHHHHQIIYSERTFGNRLEDIKRQNSNASFYLWKNVQREIRPFKDLKSAFSLYGLLRKIKSDAIHLHSSKAGFLGRLVCFLLRKRNVIYTPNGLSFTRKDVSSLEVSLYVALEKTANWLNGRVIACSKSEADELIRRNIRSSYINNGTEIGIIPSQPENAGHDQIVIATSGRVTVQKNPALFNEIAKHFENNPQYKFLWIGGGELEHLLNSKNITITGWLNRNSVLERVKDADIYISTAAWEGLPFAVIEAMSLYKPLLLSNCVGNIDLVKNGFNGFIYRDAEEAIKKITGSLADTITRMNFGINSFNLAAAHFDVIDMAKRYEAEYEFRKKPGK